MFKKTFILILLLITSICAFSQWSSPVEIWPYSMAYFQPNAAHSLVADTLGNVHITWYDYSKDAYGCIKKTRFDGTDWLYTSSFLDDAAGGTGYYALSWMPTISVEPDGKCLVVWEDYRTGSFELYAKYYNNIIWSSQMTVTNDLETYTWFPKLKFAGGKHHLIFMDDSTGWFNIYYTSFDSSFQLKTDITPIEANCINHDIAAYDDGEVSVIYTSAKDGYQTLYNVRMISGAWGSPFPAADLSADISSPNLISDGVNEYALFAANVSGVNDIFVSKYNGSSWDGEVLISDTRSNSYYPAGIMVDGKIRIVYVSDENQYGDLYYVVYNPSTGKVEERTLLASHFHGYITLPQIEMDSRGDVHVVYTVNDETPVNQDQTNDIWWTRLPHAKGDYAGSDFSFKTEVTYKGCLLTFTDDYGYRVIVSDKIGRTLFKGVSSDGEILIPDNAFERNDVYFISAEGRSTRKGGKILWIK